MDDLSLLMKALEGSWQSGTSSRPLPGSEQAYFAGPNATDWHSIPQAHKYRDPFGDERAWVKDQYTLNQTNLAKARRNEPMTLGQVMENWNLYKSYPQLANTPFRFKEDKGLLGSYGAPHHGGIPNTAWGVDVHPGMPLEQMLQVLKHEMGGHGADFSERGKFEGLNIINNRTINQLSGHQQFLNAPKAVQEEIIRELTRKNYRESRSEAMSRTVDELGKVNASSGTDFRKFYSVPSMWQMGEQMKNYPTGTTQ